MQVYWRGFIHPSPPYISPPSENSAHLSTRFGSGQQNHVSRRAQLGNSNDRKKISSKVNSDATHVVKQLFQSQPHAPNNENEYDSLFIHSVLECNKGTVYEGRQIGNCPELNPLDCSLFADLLSALSLHMCITSSLPSDHAQKFSMDSVPKIESAIHRLWCDKFPGSERISHDIHKIKDSLLAIIKNDGAMVQGLGDKYQKGVRYVAGGTGRGGARTKGVFSTPKPNRFVHQDALGLDTIVIKKALLKFEDLDEAVIGVEEGVQEGEAAVTVPEEVAYPKFVTGFGMNVVGMMLPGNRGPNKNGGAANTANPGHNYVRAKLKENNKWECFYCKKDFVQSQTVNSHMKTSCRSVPADWYCEDLKARINEEKKKQAVKDAEEKLKEEKRALAAKKKAEAVLNTKQKRKKDDSEGGEDADPKSKKASTTKPLDGAEK